MPNRHFVNFCTIAGALLLSTPALAVDLTLAPGGFTGVGITPNARMLNWGTMGLAYDNQMPGFADPKGHNFVAGFGLLPNLEIAGRIASNELNCNGFVSRLCGARDLSANVKGVIGLDSAKHWSIALGATDIGGEVNYVSSYYGVLTYSTDVMDISAGLAKRRGIGNLGSKSPLNGPFANAVLQPLPWLQGNVEISDGKAWAGAKLLAPAQWLPRGWSAYVGANARLIKTAATEKAWLNAGITIPLYTVPALLDSGPKAQATPLPPGMATEPTYPATVAPAYASRGTDTATMPARTMVAADITEARLQALAASLQAKGLEDISVGKLPDGAIAVRANNATYNWNSVDALGAALGVLAREFGANAVGYRLVLTQRQIGIVGVTGQTNCLREWIDGAPPTCTAGQIVTPGTTQLSDLYSGVAWTVNRMAPSSQTLRIGLSPVVKTRVATDVGVLDFSFGARADFMLPLWPGASAQIRPILPIANSSDYKAGGVYGNDRLRARIDRAIVTQTVRVPLERWFGGLSATDAQHWGLTALTAQAHVGRINDYYDGGLGELRWEPGEGRHRFDAQAGVFRRGSYNSSIVFPAGVLREPKSAVPLLGSYRYSVAPTRTYFEATAGQFMNKDRGIEASMTQWFSDVAVSLLARRTKADDIAAKNFIGLSVSLPLGPRKDMNAGNHFQITGAPRFEYGVETLVKSVNFVTLGYGEVPDVPSLKTLFNSDRAGLFYFEDNLRRIRDAAR